MNERNTNSKVPKGYRLKISTHKKIKELQEVTSGSQEMVIGRAIRLYAKTLTLRAKGNKSVDNQLMEK